MNERRVSFAATGSHRVGKPSDPAKLAESPSPKARPRLTVTRRRRRVGSPCRSRFCTVALGVGNEPCVLGVRRTAGGMGVTVLSTRASYRGGAVDDRDP